MIRTAAFLLAAALGVATAATAHASSAPLAGPGQVIYQHDGTETTRCTIGFAARDTAGHRLAVTAGHCGVPGQPVYTRDGQRLGAYVDVRPDDLSTQTYGYAFIALDPDVDMTAAISQTQGIDHPAAARPGDIVCMYGTTSGMQCSALETATDQAATTIGAITNGGDSGAPVVRLQDSALVGIIIGHNDEHHLTYIEPLSRITDQTRPIAALAGFGPVVAHPDLR